MTRTKSYHKNTQRHPAFACGAQPHARENAMSNLSPRSLVASAAALPALAVPAVALSAEPDPVFAAIEAHRHLATEWYAGVSREFEDDLRHPAFACGAQPHARENAMSNLSPRSLVASAAALPALAVPAVALSAEPDPVFAAIEAHRHLATEWYAGVSREFEDDLDAEAEQATIAANERMEYPHRR
jgi:hypothetical protein